MGIIKAAAAAALSFAHLANLGRAKPAAAAAESEDDEDPKKKRDDETDEEHAARVKAMEDESDDEDDKNKAAATPPAASASASTEALAAAEAEGYAKGYAASRDRCAAIFANPAAARNVALAAELAFTSDLPAERVAAVLGKAPASAHIERAARNPNLGTAPGATVSPQQAAAARWDANLAAVNPKAARR